jgi:hypothetical protein
MPVPVEIVGVSTVAPAGVTLPVADPVLGTTADTGMTVTQSGLLRRTQYKTIAAGSTWSLSTAAYIDRITVIPVSTGGTTIVLSDGTTAIMSIPAAAHAVDPHPYTVHLGIRSESTLGFEVVAGASIAAIVAGAWNATPTTA